MLALLRRAVLPAVALAACHPSAGIVGTAHAQATSYEGYEEELSKIRAEIAATKDPGEKAYGYAQTALLLLGLNRTDEALSDIAKGKALLRPQDKVPRGELLYTEAYYFKNAQRYSECEANMRAAQPIYSSEYGSDHPYLAMIETLLADCLQNQGKYAEAIDLTRHTDAIFAAQGPEYGTQRANALLSLARALEAANKQVEAEDLLREALLPARQMPPKHPIRFTVNFALASHLLGEGRPLEAIPLLQESIREGTENPAISQGQLGLAYATLGNAMLQLDRPVEASALYDKGIAMMEEAGAQLPAATQMRNAAYAADRSGDGARGAQIAQTALQTVEAAPASGELRTALAQDAVVIFLVAEGKLDEAETAARASSEVLGRLRAPNHPQATGARIQLGWVEALQGRTSEGLGLVREAYRSAMAAKREREYARNRALDNLPMIASLSQALEVGVLAGDTDFAFEVMQAIVYSDASRAAFAVAAREAAQDTELGGLLRRRQDAGAAVAEADSALLQAQAANAPEQFQLAANLVSARSALTVIDTELDARFPTFRELIQPRAATLAEIQAGLGKDEALLVIAESDRGLYTLAITRGGAVMGHDPIRREALRGLVGAVRKGIDASLLGAGGGGAEDGSEAVPFDLVASSRIEQAIFTPDVARAVQGKGTLLVATGDILSALPLSVLVTSGADKPGRARFLIEDHAIAVVPSLAALSARSGRRDNGQSLVAIGAPALPQVAAPAAADDAADLAAVTGGRAVLRSARIDRLEPLPGALDEMQRVAKLLRGRGDAVILAGAQATEPAVKALDLRHVGVLLFATHGVVAGAFDDIDEPALVLTPPQEKTALDDGLLTASEAAQLNIGANWVILSACDTAAGDTPSAAGYTGLARAFLFAGADRVVASHWPVRDDVSARLSAGIVEASRDGLSPAQALRKAVLAVKRDLPDPALWAPFMVVAR
ncbi:MAG: CHAT domain-containing protein [Sphingomonadales bacterium]|nr:CHAT domain-containing protein [Sphingomonadales bacterium]MBD3774677.1 CHAT domain-containing protein [Paracoccaceae bacterium]